MASIEVVVRVPPDWDDDRFEGLAAALEEALDRDPGLAVEVRAAAPGLLAEMDQLKAAVEETRARVDEAAARTRWLRSPWGPALYWAAGFGVGAGVTLTLVNLLG